MASFLGGTESRGQTRKDPPITICIEAEQFQFPGDWVVASPEHASDGKCLLSGSGSLPAVTAIKIQNPGRYFLWARAMDFVNDKPGTRKFTIAVGGQKSPEVFGDSGKDGFTWEAGGSFMLNTGLVALAIQPLTSFARADALILTTDPDFKPDRVLGSGGRYQRMQPHKLSTGKIADPFTPIDISEIGSQPLAVLQNDLVRYEFVPAMRGGKATIIPVIRCKTKAGWKKMAIDAGSEFYSVIAAPTYAVFDNSTFYPKWKGGRENELATTVEISGVEIKTAQAGNGAIWNAGQINRFLPKAVHQGDGRIRLDFYLLAAGVFSAEWSLGAGDRAARVMLTFTPAKEGQYSLGYHLFLQRQLAQVKEILLPMLWQRHRLPERPQTLLDPLTPTPLALAEVSEGGESDVFGVIGDPKLIPFAWPNPARPHFGLNIRDVAGAVQPSIYGPVPGTPAAKRTAGVPVSFSFLVLAQPGDWYSGYQSVVQDVFGLSDYRSNVAVSLTEAALNMIDLVKDDQAGGWWERAKAFYQIESKNGSTHSMPMTLLSLYRLTGDEEIYRRRALPTMEYMLSRESAHFSPLPHDTGRYDAGGMNGPVRMFGTDAYGGIWQLTQKRTPAFKNIAFPDKGVRSAGGFSHEQLFDEWLANYELTGDTAALKQACDLADKYLAEKINQPPDKEIGPEPFYFISFVPDWEGMLRLYEATHQQRYLEAAAFGARQLMAGIWTQPLIPAGEITIHPGGEFAGDHLPSWRGPQQYRLGTPRQANDTPERKIPAWVVSNAGLGFEQPSTFKGRDTGRQIYQMYWAPLFLRLAELTGDKMFETYARNATLGRWGNYPGYYATGFTDLPLNPRYPWAGPDVTDIYYHHIPVHLTWTIDYLVAEASLRSGGKIQFPSLRQFGYAYFDTRVYGSEPGKVYDFQNAWLWFKRGLVEISNPQINYLTAHTKNQFFAILMNESSSEERMKVRLASKVLNYDKANAKAVTLIAEGKLTATLPLTDETVEIVLPSRGLVVLRLDGVKNEVPTHRILPEAKPSQYPSVADLDTDTGIKVKAAAIQATSGSWDAYVWCAASPNQVSQATLHYKVNGSWQQLEAGEYPFEFSVPVADASVGFQYFVEGQTPAGKRFKTQEAIIGAMH